MKRIVSIVVPILILATNLISVPMEAASNRLSQEKSPYLLQHQHNPVDWYAWGEEAFAKAKAEDKPILLSIGYSTCHWCHVMEEQSFENADIAKIMNDHFVSIKVDREERPDIDSIYMSYVMATTGSGGWPMTVLLTPDQKPFYGGTYFPPQNFSSLLLGVAEAWKDRRNEILKSADSAVAFLNDIGRGGVTPRGRGNRAPTDELDQNTILTAFQKFEANFDEEHGGFGRAPKFPRPHVLSMILRVWKHSKDADALRIVQKTLDEMACGGIYDQLGGGFHRYSVDEKWRIPHYEKMLYDQALLVRAYLEAYQITKNPEYARIVRETLDYVLEKMTDKSGGFYSAEDADSGDPKDPSKKIEGAFYVWTKEEIEKILDKNETEIFFSQYGVEEVIYRVGAGSPRPGAETAPLQQIRKKLLDVRNQRPKPHLDDKILTDWNGLMIASFAFASRVLEEPRYAEAGRKAAEFISTKSNGHHRYRDGEAGITATLNDYAFLIYGYLELYQATFDEKWLLESKRLALEMIRDFWDTESAGFFLTSRNAQTLIARPKELYDGAIPSGNAMAVLDLILLGHLTNEEEFHEKAKAALQEFSQNITQDATSHPQMLIALDAVLGPFQEIVIASKESDSVVKNMLKEIDSVFLPNKVVRQDASRMVQGKTTAQVCVNQVCKMPVHSAEELKKLIMQEVS